MRAVILCSGNVSLHATCSASYVSGGILAGMLTFSNYMVFTSVEFFFLVLFFIFMNLYVF